MSTVLCNKTAVLTRGCGAEGGGGGGGGGGTLAMKVASGFSNILDSGNVKSSDIVLHYANIINVISLFIMVADCFSDYLDVLLQALIKKSVCASPWPPISTAYEY